MATKTAAAFTVSGPDTDKSYESAGAATSAAITVASRAKFPVTLYVRDADGEIVARVESDGRGNVQTYGARPTRAVA